MRTGIDTMPLDYGRCSKWLVVEEKFDLKRLEKTIFFAHEQKPQNFEQILSLKNIGPKTISFYEKIAVLCCL